MTTTQITEAVFEVTFMLGEQDLTEADLVRFCGQTALVLVSESGLGEAVEVVKECIAHAYPVAS